VVGAARPPIAVPPIEPSNVCDGLARPSPRSECMDAPARKQVIYGNDLSGNIPVSR
jgi:hypothetical protein